MALNRQESFNSSRSDIRGESSVPIFKLSSDILLVIFFLLKDRESRGKRQLRSLRDWDWLAVTWICKRWRSVALDCSGLWAEVRLFRSEERIEAFIERSRKAGLRVNFEMARRGDAEYYAPLLDDQMWRVRDFKVSAMDSGHWRWITPYLLEMTHRAKVVKFTYNLLQLFGATSYDGNLLGVPDTLPGVQLDSLTLQSVSLPWSCSLYCGLKELHLSNNVGQILTQPSVLQFITILEGCPKLRRLTLHNICPIEFETYEMKNRSVHLQHLERLDISRLPYSFLLFLLAIVEIEKNTSLHLSFDGYPRTRPSLTVTSESKRSKLLDMREMCSTIVIEFGWFHYSIQSNPSRDGSPTSSYTTVTVNTHMLPQWRKIMTSISSFIKDPHWQMADTVIFSCTEAITVPNEPLDKFSWGILLNSLPRSTKRLAIVVPYHEQEGVTALRDALVSHPEASSEDVLPGLEQLAVCHDDFSCGKEEMTQKLFLERMEERGRNATRACKVHFLGGHQLKVEELDQIFAPISK